MGGKGSGGRRPGAGRRPSSTAIKATAKSKGIKKKAKKQQPADELPSDATVNLMKSFLQKPTAPTGGSVRGPPSPLGGQACSLPAARCLLLSGCCSHILPCPFTS